jgi:hypothetical protein
MLDDNCAKYDGPMSDLQEEARKAKHEQYGTPLQKSSPINTSSKLVKGGKRRE